MAPRTTHIPDGGQKSRKEKMSSPARAMSIEISCSDDQECFYELPGTDPRPVTPPLQPGRLPPPPLVGAGEADSPSTEALPLTMVKSEEDQVFERRLRELAERLRQAEAAFEFGEPGKSILKHTRARRAHAPRDGLCAFVRAEAADYSLRSAHDQYADWVEDGDERSSWVALMRAINAHAHAARRARAAGSRDAARDHRRAVRTLRKWQSFLRDYFEEMREVRRFINVQESNALYQKLRTDMYELYYRRHYGTGPETLPAHDDEMGTPFVDPWKYREPQPWNYVHK